jgi:hypothetical protein
LTEPRDDVGAQPAGPAAIGSTEQSFPLVALLQLATYLAAMAACVDGKELVARLHGIGDEPIPAAMVALMAAGICGTIGLVIGLGQLRRWRSALAGGAFGAAVGLAILAVYIAPAPPLHTLGAAGLMLVSTLIIRLRAA